MLLKEKLEKVLNKKLSFLDEEIFLEFTSALDFGDFFTPFLMRKEKKPLKEKILKILEKDEGLKKFFERIEYKEPGFINFFLKKEILLRELKKVLSGKRIFKKRKEKIILEFISANPTGPLTLGNARGGFLGDALRKVFEKTGYRVFSEYFINDAKSSRQIKELGKTVLGKGQSYLTSYLDSLIKKLKNKKFKEPEKAGYQLATLIQRENQRFIEKKLKIKFDNWFSEEDLYRKSEIKKTFSLLKKKNLVYQKEGAFFVKTKAFGDREDRVIVRKNGIPTYFLSDIAYHLNKFKRGFDKALNIWGADHQSHIERMKAILKALKILPKKKFEVILVQMVLLKEKGQRKKMSKRKGEYLTLEELIEMVGLDVARFLFLTKAPSTHLEFDLDLALDKSLRNPVYYLQYAWVRTKSLFEKTGQPKGELRNLIFLERKEEIDLIRFLLRYHFLLEEISSNYTVYKLPNYLMDLTKLFSRFYEKCPIKRAEKREREGRLLLVKAYQKILKEGLEILGISLPEKM